MSNDDSGTDLEHVEVLQRKFDEFQKDMAAQEFRVTEVLDLADRLIKDGHPEDETINRRKEVCILLYIPVCLRYFVLTITNPSSFSTQELKDSWQRLRLLALNRQEKLFGAHEIQRFNRDADETVAWITEKDVVLSSDDFGRDLASVQTLQVTFKKKNLSP